MGVLCNRQVFGKKNVFLIAPNQPVPPFRVLRYIETYRGFDFMEPKTSRSRRNIPLSNWTIEALKDHRRSQLETKMKILSEYQNYDLVFASELGTPVLHGNLLKRHFKPLLKKAGLPNIRLYDLRHTTATLLLSTATLLLSAGENPKVVSERLGHASIVLTPDTYIHILPTMQKAATEKIEKMMFGNLSYRIPHTIRTQN